MGVTDGRLGLRDRKKMRTRDTIRREAMRLIDENGYATTTIEQIAAAADISPSTFFRYFPTKEDAVVGDPTTMGRIIVAELEARPADEDPWLAMRNALQLLVDLLDDERGLLTLRVIMSTPALRARHLEKHLAWARLLEPAVNERVGPPDETRRLRAQMLVHGSFACLDVAFGEYVSDGGATPLGDLLDQAFRALR